MRNGSCRAGLLGLTLLLTGCLSTAPAPPAPAPVPAAAAAPVAVTPQRDWSDAVLYFVIVDRFADGDPGNNAGVDRAARGTFHGGDLKGLRAQLDEIASLGVTAIWITPVVRNIDGFVTGAGFPDWGYHGYWADDFTRPDLRFGSEEDLKALVDDCHRRGMKVLLDVVYNHAGYESGYLKAPAFKGWLRSEALGTCGQDDITSCVAGLPDFKTERPEVADWLLRQQLGWARRSGVDGFRLDTVKHVTHDFWQEHRRRTRAELAPGFFLLGEVWGGDPQVLDPYFAGDEMDAGFDFGFQGNVLGFVQGRGRVVAFDRYLKSREKVRPGFLMSHFLSSHDVPGALYQLQGDRELFRLAALLQMTSIGLPTVYYGEEVGRPGGDWPDNRSDMPWGGREVLPGAGLDRDEDLRGDYRRLIAIRRAHPALSRGVHAGLVTEKDLLVFRQEDAASSDVVVVAVNRGAEAVTAHFAMPAQWGSCQVRDEWRGREVRRTPDGLELDLPPREASVLGCASITFQK
ncbi:MAG: alpha-amylase family glycosyl hydrolase [Thermoanaerobaculaceae bacterium]|nr:alpha-amylase family glycosyl hydrolase [Thermoanaerobaculaceae bacterium]